jgi:transposase
VISDVARRHDLVPQHLWNWIKAARKGRFALPGDGLPAFVPVMSLEPGQRSEPAQDVRTTAIELVIGAVTVRVRSRFSRQSFFSSVSRRTRAVSINADHAERYLGSL